jgi:hypothetical protein
MAALEDAVDRLRNFYVHKTVVHKLLAVIHDLDCALSLNLFREDNYEAV